MVWPSDIQKTAAAENQFCKLLQPPTFSRDDPVGHLARQ